jgi:hypothetical protein
MTLDKRQAKEGVSEVSSLYFETILNEENRFIICSEYEVCFSLFLRVKMILTFVIEWLSNSHKEELEGKNYEYKVSSDPSKRPSKDRK